ncbi:agamous-like MADS-box protein AGL103 [Impatiens glandulifera]|uniref:agamous-like MADS-box protein AGL103 n=1 Tax=Impatiens glandulifera TaxID=253017 RepID=UPI001FB15DDA|nr:agamous-like MADS-box protein AGL103 [Impatiens glandulifera]
MVKEGAKENTIKCDKKKQQLTMKMTNIKKKSMELSSLCDIDVCFLCLEENGRIESWPDNLNQVKPILERYKKEVSKRKKKTSTTIAATDHVQTYKSGSSKARIGPLLDGLSQKSLKIFSNQIAEKIELIANQLSSKNQSLPLLNSEEEMNI